MKIVSFLFYYSKLLIGIALGVHPTVNPPNVKWRWDFWQMSYAKRRRFSDKQNAEMQSKPLQKTDAESLSILQRIGKADQSAVNDCIEAYGNLIWALAKHYASSPEEAETATLEIFRDIWRYASRFDPANGEEINFFASVARRRAIKRKFRTILDSSVRSAEPNG